MPVIDFAERKKFIEEYLHLKFKVIPLHPNKKTPIIQWKKNYTVARIRYFFHKNPNANVGIVTGVESHLIVLDVDNRVKAKEILREIMANPTSIFNTCCIATDRGLHLYYKMATAFEGVRNQRINKFMELKANGGYVVAAPSIHPSGQKYRFLSSLANIKVFSADILIELSEQKIEISEKIDLKHIRYNGKNVDCIRQILERNLAVGERDESFFILFCLLLQNGNSRNYSVKIVEEKNESITNSMNREDLFQFVLSGKKRYTLSCAEVRKRLPFVDCTKCRFIKEDIKKMINAEKYWQVLEQLSSTEFKVYMIIKTGKTKGKSLNWISKIYNLSRQTLAKTSKKLVDEGFLKPSEL